MENCPGDACLSFVTVALTLNGAATRGNVYSAGGARLVTSARAGAQCGCGKVLPLRGHGVRGPSCACFASYFPIVSHTKAREMVPR
jgi:hypothetical protein